MIRSSGFLTSKNSLMIFKKSSFILVFYEIIDQTKNENCHARICTVKTARNDTFQDSFIGEIICC